MASLAIVIPWWNGQSGFDETLASVLQNRPPNCEVWVIHNHPYNDPWQLAGEVNFCAVDGPNEVSLIEHGWRRSQAPLVHVLRCGYEVLEGWTEPAVHRFHRAKVAAVAPIILQRDAPERLAAAGVRLTRFAQRRVVGTNWPVKDFSEQLAQSVAGPTLSAGFYRREALEAVGGFEPWIGDYGADAHLATVLQQSGWTCVVETKSQIVGPAEPVRQPGYAAARSRAVLYWEHRPRSLWLAHLLRAALVLGDACRCRSLAELWAELTGSWRGYRDSLWTRRHACRGTECRIGGQPSPPRTATIPTTGTGEPNEITRRAA